MDEDYARIHRAAAAAIRGAWHWADDDPVWAGGTAAVDYRKNWFLEGRAYLNEPPLSHESNQGGWVGEEP